MFYGMVYLSHPFGNDERNREDSILIERGINLVKDKSWSLTNPLNDKMFSDHAESVQRYSNSEALIFKYCAGALSVCKMVIFCPGWEKSRGCRYEHFVAKYKNIPRIYLTKHEAALFREFATKDAIDKAKKEEAA